MRRRILVVDDEIRYRELYMQVLAGAGFATEAAASAEEAIRIIENSVPALVVSDIRMPGMNGIELLRKVRENYDTLPFLLVTAYAEVRDAVQALKLGAVDPVALHEVLGHAVFHHGNGE